MQDNRRDTPRITTRLVLLVVVLLLAVNVTFLVALRQWSRSQPPPAQAAGQATSQPKTEPVAPSGDGAAQGEGLARARRAQAIYAITSGEYETAIEILGEVLRSGSGVGDESKLLSVALDLKERHGRSAGGEKGRAVDEADELAAAPERRERAPAAKPKRASTPSKPSAPEAPARGDLLVLSIPSGLSVEIDGRAVGRTPVRSTQPVGRHVVTLLQGSQRVEERFATVSSNALTTVEVEARQLIPTPAAPPREQPAPVAQVEEIDARPAELLPEPEPAEPPPSAPSVRASEPVALSERPERADRGAERPANGVGGAGVNSLGSGQLFVSSMNVAGVVWVNGREVGAPPVYLKDLPAGQARVELRVGSEVKRSMLVNVEAKRSARVRFR